ncbi:MAG: hypothetical protein HY391_05755 [Deltaproteobacteria bacterium]|nr:hypothetical protein [Deltaproteobacteria bacterium]
MTTRGIKYLTLSFTVILAGMAIAWQASADEILQETVKKDVMTEADIAYTTVAKVNSDTAVPSRSAAAERSEMTTVTSETKSPSAEEVWNRFSVTGVGGFMNPLNGSNQLKGQFSTGLLMGFDITDHVALEGNLIYSKYAVKGGYYGYVFGSHYY